MDPRFLASLLGREEPSCQGVRHAEQDRARTEATRTVALVSECCCGLAYLGADEARSRSKLIRLGERERPAQSAAAHVEEAAITDRKDRIARALQIELHAQ